MTAPGRYDGHAQWSDQQFVPDGEEVELLGRLLGAGDGRLCLDVACGAGRYLAGIAGAGYRVLGVDVSADQLRIAGRRSSRLIRADAGALPLRSDSVGAAVGMYFHTDVEDFAPIVAEIARCLEPAARLVYVGLHPCFIGPFVDRTAEDHDGALRFVPGYGVSAWARRGSGGGTGLWARVGGHHKTLAGFLAAFVDAGLRLEGLIELQGGGSVLPRNIAVVATKG